jgi:hypothetical protein
LTLNWVLEQLAVDVVVVELHRATLVFGAKGDEALNVNGPIEPPLVDAKHSLLGVLPNGMDEVGVPPKPVNAAGADVDPNNPPAVDVPNAGKTSKKLDAGTLKYPPDGNVVDVLPNTPVPVDVLPNKPLPPAEADATKNPNDDGAG